MTSEELKVLKREACRKGTSAARLLELGVLEPVLARLIAKNQHTPVQVLEGLAKSRDMHTRRAVAAHPSTSAQTLELLASDRQGTVLKAVAANGNTPPDVIQHLASHKGSTVRAATLDFPHRPAGLLKKLSRDPDEIVRGAAARDSQQTGSTLHDLQRDQAGYVRACALFNRQTSLETRLQALADADGQVRAAALHSLGPVNVQHLTEQQKRSLILDPDASVRHLAVYAFDFLSLPEEQRVLLASQFLHDEDEKVREMAAAYIPHQELTVFLHDSAERVRQRAAVRTEDLHLQLQFTDEPSPRVRQSLVYNAAAFSGVLVKVIQTIDTPSWLYPAFTDHKNLPRAGWLALLNNQALVADYGFYFLDLEQFPDDLRDQLMRKLVSYGPSLYYHVGVQPDIPNDLIALVAPNFGEDSALFWAHHRSRSGHTLPSYVLEKLAAHPDTQISESAKLALAQHGATP